MKLTIEDHLKCTDFPRVGVIIAKDDVILSRWGFEIEVDEGRCSDRIHRGKRAGNHFSFYVNAVQACPRYLSFF
jgi:hypothetical protein